MLYLNMSRLSGKSQITLPNSDLEKKGGQWVVSSILLADFGISQPMIVFILWLTFIFVNHTQCDPIDDSSCRYFTIVYAVCVYKHIVNMHQIEMTRFRLIFLWKTLKSHCSSTRKYKRRFAHALWHCLPHWLDFLQEIRGLLAKKCRGCLITKL